MMLNPPPGVAAGANLDTPPLARSAVVLLLLAMLAPLALYLGTVRSIVSIWNSSETFAHGYVIMPISLWLIWRRRANFSLYPARPYAPALIPLALLGAGWLAAQLGEVQVVSQYAFVAMLPVAVLALLGPRLAGSLTFPLLFLLFAVPFGEVFVEPLIHFTADFTVAAVRATGIPVLRSGTRFELPTGNWSVVEACSGVRYLISSITLGCLYAYLTYRSAARRALFIALSVAVPILANGVRAYMIVMIGHLSGMELATGVDHLIYGWLFFGLVMFIMFWIGSYWREDTEAPAPRSVSPLAAAAPPSLARICTMAVALLALLSAWPVFAHLTKAANADPRPVQLAAVQVGWPQAPAFSSWTPHYMTPDATFKGVYRDPAGTLPVALTVLYYRNQDRSKSLISSLNQLAGPKDAWHAISSGLRVETASGRQLALRETVMQNEGAKMLVWQWMWIDGREVSNDYVGKLLQARARLLFHGDDGAAIMVSAPFEQDAGQARAALRAFVASQFNNIQSALLTAQDH